jgi:AcrR family transcriptional regulator
MARLSSGARIESCRYRNARNANAPAANASSWPRPANSPSSEGWDAVTTRLLAERIEYSQPVLYSHFRGKREIIGAVALEGATEMAAAVRATAADANSPRERAAAVAHAYLDFAERNPAVYDAIFQLDGGLPFADEDTPAPLKDAFNALLENLGEVAGDGIHPGLFTETFWAALHGLVTLTRAGRLPPQDTERRVELLVDRLAIV